MLDMTSATQLSFAISEALGITVPSNLGFDCPTIDAMVEYLWQQCYEMPVKASLSSQLPDQHFWHNNVGVEVCFGLISQTQGYCR